METKVPLVCRLDYYLWNRSQSLRFLPSLPMHCKSILTDGNSLNDKDLAQKLNKAGFWQPLDDYLKPLERFGQVKKSRMPRNPKSQNSLLAVFINDVKARIHKVNEQLLKTHPEVVAYFVTLENPKFADSLVKHQYADAMELKSIKDLGLERIKIHFGHSNAQEERPPFLPSAVADKCFTALRVLEQVVDQSWSLFFANQVLMRIIGSGIQDNWLHIIQSELKEIKESEESMDTDEFTVRSTTYKRLPTTQLRVTDVIWDSEKRKWRLVPEESLEKMMNKSWIRSPFTDRSLEPKEIATKDLNYEILPNYEWLQVIEGLSKYNAKRLMLLELLNISLLVPLSHMVCDYVMDYELVFGWKHEPSLHVGRAPVTGRDRTLHTTRSRDGEIKQSPSRVHSLDLKFLNDHDVLSEASYMQLAQMILQEEQETSLLKLLLRDDFWLPIGQSPFPPGLPCLAEERKAKDNKLVTLWREYPGLAKFVLPERNKVAPNDFSRHSFSFMARLTRANPELAHALLDRLFGLGDSGRTSCDLVYADLVEISKEWRTSPHFKERQWRTELYHVFKQHQAFLSDMIVSRKSDEQIQKLLPVIKDNFKKWYQLYAMTHVLAQCLEKDICVLEGRSGPLSLSSFLGTDSAYDLSWGQDVTRIPGKLTKVIGDRRILVETKDGQELDFTLEVVQLRRNRVNKSGEGMTVIASAHCGHRQFRLAHRDKNTGILCDLFSL